MRVKEAVTKVNMNTVIEAGEEKKKEREFFSLGFRLRLAWGLRHLELAASLLVFVA